MTLALIEPCDWSCSTSAKSVIYSCDTKPDMDVAEPVIARTSLVIVLLPHPSEIFLLNSKLKFYLSMMKS